MTDRDCVRLLQWALPRAGLRWPGFRRVRRQVCKRISRRMAELGLPDAEAYRARLEADPDEWRVFDACCQISISRFWRDHRVFDALARRVLPDLAHAARNPQPAVVRAWSLGCGSGEEPYSLRLAWDLGAATTVRGVALHIVATDANARLLERARRGVYPASALAELPSDWRSRAFETQDDGFRLRDRHRSGVELRQQDVREVMPRGPFDLILCRNLVFTYFALELQREVLAKLLARIRRGGLVLLGSHEELPEPTPELEGTDVVGLYRAVGSGR